MGDNVIYNEKNECIGYYADLVKLYKVMIKTQLGEDDYEEVAELAKNLQEIEEYEDYEGLLVLSDNNGMGFTIKKYNDN